MKVKPKPQQQKQSPKVTIIRPSAVVTVTIDGVAYKLSETEARQLHASLGSALGIPEPMPDYIRERLRQPAQWDRPRLPSIPFMPVIQPPALPYHLDRVMCSKIGE